MPSELPATQLLINEFLASNDSTIADPQGEFDDYVELFNPLPEVLNIEGMYLSDDSANWKKWQFPAGTIIPGEGYLLVWADGDEGDYPGLHTNFKLNRTGETIILSDSDLHGNALLDSLNFTEQTTDISFGRYPDGGDNLGFMEPSPSSTNKPLEVFRPSDAILPSAGIAFGCFPNPFNPMISIQLYVSPDQDEEPFSADIFNSGGRLIRNLLEQHRLRSGLHTLTWNGVNADGNMVSSGVYILRIRTGKEFATKNLVLCR